MAWFFLIANYIVEAKEMLFKIKLQNFKETMAFVEAEIPAPMSGQFTDRIGKTKASEKKASNPFIIHCTKADLIILFLIAFSSLTWILSANIFVNAMLIIVIISPSPSCFINHLYQLLLKTKKGDRVSCILKC